MNNSYKQILDIVKHRGLIRPRDLVAQNLPRIMLTRMVEEGKLVRVSRGIYTAPNRKVSEHSALTEIGCKYPQSIICLLSALRFHGLTAQLPFEVWTAIESKSRTPKIDYPPLRIVRFSGVALTLGIDEIVIEKVTVRITNQARTVVDCFKFRNQIGLDVALEALQEVWRLKRVNMDELWSYATQLRIANVIRPYLESLQ
ncbi:MAG: type IV toxin-antitoxin system AbiEi family antitoxin domain-containing protein [Pseudomonadota bacterium]